jgi:K(+)-stimulated pyrophosphate-energized sodium pump
MGADLFESYVDSIIAAMAIGVVTIGLSSAVVLPMMLAGLGILVSIIGTFFVRTKEGKDPRFALNKGIFASAILMFIFSYFLITYVSGQGAINVWYSVISGLIAGIVIGLVTEYYTSENRGPARSIAEASQTGAATNIIAGLSVGMKSTAIPVIAVGSALMISYHFAGLYGIAIAAVGMLSTLGITLATDTYGPVADNAAGIAEMAGLGKEIRERCETLDAVGNTTAAIGKGFAIGSAALTALALFAVYGTTVGLTTISLLNPTVVTGLFIGALLPFLFSAFTMNAVGKAAFKIVNEVRRQFRTIKGIMEGKGKPDYNKCIEISTHAALRQMVVPSLLAILAPIAVGLFLGAEALGGMLAGAIASGFLLALLMANAGGAWDNAKKYIEKGNLGGKGSDNHKASVVGDTVGDPCKDTSAPSLNILIKLMSIVALVFAPLFL